MVKVSRKRSTAAPRFFLQHGSILLEFLPLDLASVLKIETVSIEKWVALIREKVTSFKDLGVAIRPKLLAETIKESFENLYGLEFESGSLIQEENELVERLTATKYTTDEWNLYRSRSFNQVQHII